MQLRLLPDFLWLRALTCVDLQVLAAPVTIRDKIVPYTTTRLDKVEEEVHANFSWFTPKLPDDKVSDAVVGETTCVVRLEPLVHAAILEVRGLCWFDELARIAQVKLLTLFLDDLDQGYRLVDLSGGDGLQAFVSQS